MAIQNFVPEGAQCSETDLCMLALSQVRICRPPPLSSLRSGHIYMKYAHSECFMGRLDDIQTTLTPLKKTEKIEINVYHHFRTS